MNCPACAKNFNDNAPRAAARDVPPAKPKLPLYDICPCYRPKQPG